MMSKQTLLLRFLLIVFGGSLLGSCGHSNNVVSHRLIQKRKHNKGWFIKWGESDNSKDAAKEDDVKKGKVAEVKTKPPITKEITVVNTTDRSVDSKDISGSNEESIRSESKVRASHFNRKRESNIKSRTDDNDNFELDEAMSYGRMQFPGNPFMPQFRPYDYLLHPIFVLASFVVLVALVLMIFLVVWEDLALLLFVILTLTFALLFLGSFIRLLIGLHNYGISSGLELAALIVGGIGFVAILTSILLVIFL